jgi:CubicO group peptidase (beta-lactamase class C family)
MAFDYLLAAFLLIASGLSTTADEAIEHKGLSANELSAYVQQLTSQGKILTDLNVRIVERKTLFDVTAHGNQDKLAWLIQVNISDREFRDSSKRYSADGFENTIHRIIPNGRQKLHSTVWVQRSEETELLQLPEGPIPVTGEPGNQLEPINELLLMTLQDNNIPGATVSVAWDGAIVFERGFGYSDLEPETPMAANTVMRIASISKPITAVAVLLLMEDGKLKLDDNVIDFLTRDKRFVLPKNADAAWKRVTIRHLLQHSGGWNRDELNDPMFALAEITRAMKLRKLAEIPDIVRYQLTKPIDFEPGSKYQYSNFGFCLLGRVIEAASQQSYEAFVNDRILIPARMTQTRLARTKLADRADDEVHYYTQKLKTYPAIWDVAPGTKGKFELVPAPYGQWKLEVMDAHAGWISTASDLVRFALAIDAPVNPLLKLETRRLMQERPAFASVDNDNWYGLGWDVRANDSSDHNNISHIGMFPGTSTMLVKRSDGLIWAILFNTNESKHGMSCTTVIDLPMHAAVRQSNRIP